MIQFSRGGGLILGGGSLILGRGSLILGRGSLILGGGRFLGSFNLKDKSFHAFSEHEKGHQLIGCVEVFIFGHQGFEGVAVLVDHGIFIFIRSGFVAAIIVHVTIICIGLFFGGIDFFGFCVGLIGING
jgi:hypothetical protein